MLMILLEAGAIIPASRSHKKKPTGRNVMTDPYSISPRQSRRGDDRSRIDPRDQRSCGAQHREVVERDAIECHPAGVREVLHVEPGDRSQRPGEH